MNIKRLNKIIASVLLTGSLAIASSAQATIITSSFTNTFEATELAQTGSLNKFDSALGSLNSVTLTLTAESLSSTLLTNNAANSTNFEFSSALKFYFDLSSVNVYIPSPGISTTLASTPGLVTLASGASLNIGPVSNTANYTVTLSAPAELAYFVGTGVFDTSCSTLSTSTFVGGGANIGNVQTTTAFCSGDISYDYTTKVVTPPTNVSAPATALLFGAGLLGVAFTRRTKKTAK